MNGSQWSIALQSQRNQWLNQLNEITVCLHVIMIPLNCCDWWVIIPMWFHTVWRWNLSCKCVCSRAQPMIYTRFQKPDAWRKTCAFSAHSGLENQIHCSVWYLKTRLKYPINKNQTNLPLTTSAVKSWLSSKKTSYMKSGVLSHIGSIFEAMLAANERVVFAFIPHSMLPNST